MGGNDNLDRGLRKSVDWKLVIVYLLLVFIGWINIYASIHSAEPSSIFDWGFRSGKQFVWMLSAFLMAILILFAINPKLWEVLATPSYVIVLGLLVLVIFVSKDVKGSHSWFEFGPVKFQPAEISKITTSLLLAMTMSKPNFNIRKFGDLLRAAFIILVPMLTIVAESETGSALVYVGFIFVLYREGFSGWWLFLIGMAIVLFIVTLKTEWWISLIVIGVLALAFIIRFIRDKDGGKSARRSGIRNTILAAIAGVALVFASDFLFNDVLKEHQRLRIEVLLGMKDDPSGVGYNVRQSMIAIGSGGLFGLGLGKGNVRNVVFSSTDLIFGIVQ